jgi:cobalt-zinc-cadmium efflux system outer membrane protein
MFRARFAILFCLIVAWPRPGLADDAPTELTRERVVELARAGAPAVQLASAEIEEARGRLVTARVLMPDNPVLEVVTGPRFGDERAMDVEAALVVPFEVGGRRAKRIAVADQDVARASHGRADTERLTISSALAAYYRVLHAEAVRTLAIDRRTLADELLAATIERKTAGDATTLDVNVADTEAALAESEVLASQAEIARARADLGLTLGIPIDASVVISGALDDRTRFASLVAATGERSDVKAARAELATAGAELVLARAQRWPHLSARVSYAREDGGTHILMAGLAITLPFFERGQGATAEARAKSRRAEIELSTRTTTATVEVDAARRSFDAEVAALQVIEERAVPRATETEMLARESYRAGKLDLTSLIVIRRDALAARRAHLDRQLDVSLAGVELAAALEAPP